ncbi:glycerophosphodiester phosphodiesterase family protein [Candidatus Poribacteria bacterium]|nr:glycerophosphodiester phosphodiesterase family protein [Candidatus Poribacteria bacterium]
MPQGKKIEIVCHKGANEYAPENTFAATQLCIDWGMDYVEIDVNASKDGVLYILHGPEVDKTTNGKGRITDLTSEEIDRLDAGSWFHPKFAGERVPRLEPFLRWLKGKAKVFLDVKTADPQQLIDLIYDVGLENNCFFWSDSDEWMLKFRALDGKLQLKRNVKSVADVIEAAERYRANIVEVGLDNMSHELVAACRARGLKIMIYHQEKDPEAFRQVIRWGADMINLNHGDVFAQVARGFRK